MRTALAFRRLLPLLAGAAGLALLAPAPALSEPGRVAVPGAMEAPDEGNGHALAHGMAMTQAQRSQTDTLRTRADTLRARVLERIREQTAPPPDPDTIPEVDPDSVPAAPAPSPAALPGARPDGGATRSGQVPLPAGADSIMRALALLPGFTAATFEGRRAEYTSETRQLFLTGTPGEGDAAVPARFFGQGIRLEADTSITYDDRTGRVRTQGSTLLTPDRGDPVRSRTLIFDVNNSRGTALGAETTYAEGGGEWIVRGDLDSVEDGRIFGSRTRFTSDDRPEPNSYFEATELKVLAGNILVARSVRLHFADVPVAWLPFLAQPLQSGRSSGILTPRFSVNDIVRTSGGYQRRISNVGFYWAMSDYSDATLAADWWSGEYTALTGSLRYRWARQFLQGEFSGRRFWRDSGATDLAISTRNNWEPTERTRVSASGQYVSNTGIVTQNSLDPRELTSSINSRAAVQQRFGWGNLSVEADRKQFLSDDRVESTLPTVNLSFNSFTLFRETPNRASWYNNMTASASTRFQRQTFGYPEEEGPDAPAFQFNRTDREITQGSGRASLSLGNLSLGGDASYRENAFFRVPENLARPREPFPIIQPGDELDADQRPRVDFADAEIRWSTSVGFQQRLIGTSSITPSLSLGGQLLRVDSIAEAQSFVESPTRLTFGVGLQTELYGFFPGFGNFEAVRHKVTPQFSYAYAPASTPTELQRRVFGSNELRVQSRFTFGFNQTFEARVRGTDEDSAPRGATDPGPGPDPDAEPDMDPGVEPDADRDLDPDDPDAGLALPQDGIPAAGVEGLTPDPAGGAETRRSLLDDETLQRPPPSRVVTLLALSTQALTYDLVEADSTGQWLDGFTTLSIRNSVRSDFLRGLDLSFTHDLWAEPDSLRTQRSFSPHLSQLAVGFALDGDSRIVQALGGWLGLGGGGGDPAPRATERPADRMDDDMGELGEPADGFDDNRVLPGFSGGGRRGGQVSMRRDGWDARLRYALRRPRSGQGTSQMINGTMSFQPTELLGVSWTTAYDVEARRFSDHMVTVMRDMYDWEATFGFRQAVNGNWTFRFEVSLKANRDLRFDHETRNLDGGASRGEFIGGGGF